MSDEELEEKFFACAGTRTERAREKQVREAVASLARANSLNELHSALD